MVNVSYQHRIGNDPELVGFSHEDISYEDACKVIDNYPWESELKLFEKYGEGGGFNFVLSGLDGGYADFQFIPVDLNNGFLDLNIVLKEGLWGIFGRKSKSLDYDVVSISEAKTKLRELFDYSLSSLYDKYK